MSERIPVIPAKAGIQGVRLQRTRAQALDPRGDDEERETAR
jgi:hypothetical protein